MGSEVQVLPGPPAWRAFLALAVPISDAFTPDGGVAQLGEHLLCKQGVIGSIPIVSMGVGCGLFHVEAIGSGGARLACSGPLRDAACFLGG